VPAALWEAAPDFMPRGVLHSPYGATEALPVSTVSRAEVDIAAVRGACVGRPVADVAVKIIALDDGPIATLAAARELPRGATGEIVVRGPVVTRAYDAQPAATAAAKIVDGTAIWHRMGDCGYFDADGRLWFCGRKAERVETAGGTLHTEPCEQVFRRHPHVTRCALIALGERGRQRPALVIETGPGGVPDRETLARELRDLALQYEHTRAITTFYFHPKFPVDVRHNAKIHRLALAQWSAGAPAFAPA
jgi:acyl-CoA synthetase (AMP-forming)/AMP-acid ligase II